MSDQTPSMAARVDQYLKHRRQFGFYLKTERFELLNFARFADTTAPGQPVTTALVWRWLKANPARLKNEGRSMSIVRGFAEYCAHLDPRTQVPPMRVTRRSQRWRAPHIFTAKEVELILARCEKLGRWWNSFAPHTYRTFIGLLACTGMRTCEVMALKDDDLNVSEATLRIPAAKRSGPRVVPLHPTTVAALQHYQEERRKRFPLTVRLLVSVRGRPLHYHVLHEVFQRLTKGIANKGGHPSVRLYDFRHTFATKLIARWGRKREPLARRLLALSRYLGHRNFEETFWYVQSDPSALRAAAARFERYQDDDGKASS